MRTSGGISISDSEQVVRKSQEREEEEGKGVGVFPDS